jgi:hypothetical protein
MPLDGQYGFIFNYNNNSTTLAHELAHGAFNLRHTFSSKAQYQLSQRTTQNLLDYTNATELWKYQWDLIHNPETILLGFMQNEEEGASATSNGQYVNGYIKIIRCLKQKGVTSFYDASFKYNYGENKYDAWSHPTLLNDKKYGNIWVWYTCGNSESIDISSVKKRGGYVYVGKDGGCQLKFIIRDNNYNESEELAQTLIDYLNVPANTYNSQFNKLIVEISNKSTDKIIDEIFNMSVCMAEMLSAEWRFFFLEKILNQDATLTEREAICINRLLSTVKDEGQASALIASIKEKEYEKKMIKSISNIRSKVFSNIANGLSWLYYSQNRSAVLEAGKNINAENFYTWEPFGNVEENYKTAAKDPTYSNIFDWIYNSRTYSYTVHLENDGRFRVHTIGTEFSHFGLATYHYDFYIKPFETVSVYFATRNKYINIEDNTVTMPGILLAWMIDQGERETNQMMIDIGVTAASFYIGGSAIVKSTATAGKVINSILFVKGFSDLIINSNNEEVKRILGKNFIEAYKDVSNIIDCGLIFKQFADKEINQEILMLSKAWGAITETNKSELKNNFPSIFSFIELKLKELK